MEKTRYRLEKFSQYSERATQSDLRIVLLGKNGDDISAVGNMIRGRKAFKDTSKVCVIQRGRVEERNISVIDTPGFTSNEMTDEDLQNEMMKSLSLSHPGPHVFLLIIRSDTFTDDDVEIVVQKIEGNFGAQVFKFTLVLFIRDQMTNKEWMVLTLSKKYHDLIDHFNGKYHVINNPSDITEKTTLLKKIDKIVKQNANQHYNSDTNLKSPTSRKDKRKKIEQEKENQDKGSQEQGKELRVEWTRLEIDRDGERSVIQKTTVNIGSEPEKCNKTERRNVYAGSVKENIIDVDEMLSKISEVQSLRNSFERMAQKNDTIQKEDVKKKRESWKTKEKEKEKSEQTDQKHSCTSPVTPQHGNEDLRIVLVGKSGAGKSATGNTILGGNKFKEDMSTESITKQCQKHQGEVVSKVISVIDTPGLFDTTMTNEEVKDEIVRCVEMSAPGPHVFLLIIRLDVRFTDEEKKTVKWIEENFSADAMNYAMVLFTRGDQLDHSIEDFLKKNAELKVLVDKCKGGYHVFNNKAKNQAQVIKLLEKINKLVMENRGEHYTNYMYRQAQRKIVEEQKRREEEEKRKRKEEIDMIRKAERDEITDNVKKVALAVGAGVGVAGAVALGATPAAVIPPVMLAVGAALTEGETYDKDIWTYVSSA